MPTPEHIDVAPEVAAALAGGGAVVALESTIITHGMPWPQNNAMAARVEEIIREEGATPATIAVVDGRLKIGLSATEREALAQTQGALKLSRADLAFAKLTMITEGRGIIFDGAVLEGASFTDSSLDNASFVRASLRKAPHPALTPPPHTRSARATAGRPEHGGRAQASMEDMRK